MSRSRVLTLPQRWELGLLLVMLCMAFLTLAAIVKVVALPSMMALDPQAPQNAKESAKSPLNQPTSQNVPSALPVIRSAHNQVAPPAAPLPLATAAPALVEAPFVVEEPLIEQTATPSPASPEYKYYNGKKYQYVRTVHLLVTAYAPDPRCCYPYDGTTTASGLSVKTNGGKLVAADTKLIPMHSLVTVAGYAGGTAVPVLDRGSAIKGHRLDVLLPTFDQARQWGARPIDVKVYEPIN